MSNPRADIYRENKPLPEISERTLIQEVKVDHPIDKRFLTNKYIPVDPGIIEEKRKAYLEELERWAELEN